MLPPALDDAVGAARVAVKVCVRANAVLRAVEHTIGWSGETARGPAHTTLEPGLAVAHILANIVLARSLGHQAGADNREEIASAQAAAAEAAASAARAHSKLVQDAQEGTMRAVAEPGPMLLVAAGVALSEGDASAALKHIMRATRR